MRTFADETPRHMRTRNIRTAVFALALALGLGGCHHEPDTLSGKIDRLRKQVVADSVALFEMETVDYQRLYSDFRYCDSLLQHLDKDEVETAFGSLDIIQAYLQQFKEVQPVMIRKMRYALLQLDLLEADATSQYLSDSLAHVYLNDESRVADTLHNQVAYFKDRLGQCRTDLNAFKKHHK